VKRFVDKYVAFIRQPDVGRLLVIALFTRMPVGMVGFSMVMFLRESLGDFARAGMAVGANFVAMAAIGPIVGRIIDRKGPRIPLLVTGIVQPLALTGVLVCARFGWPFPFVLAAAALAGVFATPITTLTRTIWRHRFDREEDRRTAFALDAVTIEINFTFGPALVATILASAGATAAFATAIAAVVAAIIVFISSPGLRYFKRSAGAQRHMLGPLVEPRLLLVFVVTFGLALSFGQIEVGYPAYATALAIPALAGALLAVNSIGSALGGAIFGGLHMNAPVERQLAGTMGVMALPMILHAVAPTPFVFGIVAFFTGALIAPSIASQSVLVSRLAPSHYATEAFTWSSAFIVSGLGAGMALGGYLAETAGVRAPFIVGSVVVGSTGLLALGIRSPRAAASAAD
jgi:MFS family permease